MARGKKVKSGGKGRGVVHQGRRSNGSSSRHASRGYRDDTETATFTLRDAARIEHTSSSWTPNTSLRHRTISFVRSDAPSPLDDGPNDSPGDASEDTQAEDAAYLTTTLPDLCSLPPLESHRAQSPVESNTSEEVVLFRGRKPIHRAVMNGREQSHHQVESRNKTISGSTAAPAVMELDLPKSNSTVFKSQPSPMKGSPHAATATALEDFISLSTVLPSRRKSRTRQMNRMELDVKVDTDDVLEDYVTNLHEHYGAGANDGMPVSNPEHESRDGWSSADLQDFDEMSTSEEVLDVIKQVLSKRHRPSGLQYLVVWRDSSVDDARWIPHASLTMDGAAELIADFEESEKYIPEYPEGSTDDDDDDDDDRDNENDLARAELANGKDSDEDDSDEGSMGGGNSSDEDEFEDDRDLIERRIARLDDEELARMFAKQEELGLDSADLILYDGMFADDSMDAGSSDAELQMALAASKRHGQRRRKGSKRSASSFGVLEELALFGEDSGGDFDLMDRERPSISRTAKKKVDPLLWGLSDSDQANALHDTWAADRAKKKAKKQEREELRAQGLLGKKNKFKPDLRAKYRDGIDVDQLGEELRIFLFSTAESRALPPMDKHDRKVMHEIASTFGLKSFSRGSGRTRFTTLQKTSKTTEFDSELYMRLRARLVKRFYPRMDRKPGASREVPRKRGGGSGVVRADFGYREGEVVGGTAPELGSENRGRAMLEKMGWTTGNALGALNNKGILQPIAHVVRNSRAGLG